jgi:hypothetical protein
MPGIRLTAQQKKAWAAGVKLAAALCAIESYDGDPEDVLQDARQSLLTSPSRAHLTGAHKALDALKDWYTEETPQPAPAPVYLQSLTDTVKRLIDAHGLHSLLEVTAEVCTEISKHKPDEFAQPSDQLSERIKWQTISERIELLVKYAGKHRLGS